jgi:uncharacterized protein with HEPN domain
MIEVAELIAKFISGRRRVDLDTDLMLLFALVRAVEVFGEAAAKISTDMRESAAEVPWSQIVAMRNRLIHAYFDINRTMVCKTATEEIPTLLPALRALAQQT